MFIQDYKNRSKAVVEIGTKFSKQMYKEKGWPAEDVTLEIEKSFHDAVHKYIEDHIIDNEDFESDILELMEDDLIEGTDDFSKLGKISLSVSQQEKNITEEKQVELKNSNLHSDQQQLGGGGEGE